MFKLQTLKANRTAISVAAACFALSPVANAVAQNDTAFAIVSSKGNYWKNADVSQGGGNATVTVNANDAKQEWYGFGGTFNEQGWDALGLLSDSERDRAMRLLFDKEDGIGFPWGRIPIGASDYALERYTLDDSNGDDYEMNNFSISRDERYLIPYIKAAQAIKDDLKFWASPWTPPPWMKSGAMDGAGYDAGVMRNEARVFDAHALYFSKFIQAYGEKGIPISAVCPQNEPGYTRNYPTCGWGKYNDPSFNEINNPEYLSTFVADHLHPKLQQDHPETEIWFGTLSNNVSAPGYWNGMKQKLGGNVKNVIKGLGMQWNLKDSVPKNVADGYFVFCSEHQCGNYHWLPDRATSREDANRNNYLEGMAPNNHAYGEESWDLISGWLKNGTHMYSAWNMVLDQRGMSLGDWPQNALLAVNRDTRTLEVTPYYYVMRHIGQYVDNSGAVRVGTSGGNALAFKNANGGIVTAISNTGGQTQMTVAVNGINYQFTHPGQGWATLYVGPATVKSKKAHVSKQLTATEKAIRITGRENGYAVALPSNASGRIELLTLTGRILESRAISQGSSEVLLGKQAHTGLLLVRVVQGNDVHIARLCTR